MFDYPPARSGGALMLVCILLLTDCVENVVKQNPSGYLALTMTVAAALGAAGLLGAPVRAEEGVEEGAALIERVVAQTARTGLALRATRELRAGTVAGKYHGW